MAENTIKMRIQNKYDTKENWAENNPVLKAGELGFDDLGRAKVGDGINAWNDLNYINDITNLHMITDTAESRNAYLVPKGIDSRVFYYGISKDTELMFETADKLYFIEKRIYIENTGENGAFGKRRD